MCSICKDPAHEDNLADWGDLEDPMFSGRAPTEPADFSARADIAPADFASTVLKNARHIDEKPAGFIEDCPKCHGSGKFRGYTGRIVGDCFHCKGEGKVLRKTSAEAREKAAQAKKDRHAAKIKAWTEAHPDEFAWLIAATARGFEFAVNQMEALAKYGDLSEGRLNGIRKCIVKDQQREQEKAEIAARAPDIAGDSLDKIMTAFRSAVDHGIKFPKMRLGTFIFSLVRSGQNAGAIYVKTIDRDEEGERKYLGKIVDGRFVRGYKVSEETQTEIVAVAMDPEAAATAYGRRTGTCSICGRELTRNESIDRAMGPICAGKYGWG